MWPALEDFIAWLSAAGLPTTNAESALKSAVKSWQRDTGFTPFVAASGDVDKWLTPSDYQQVLDFEGGFVSVTSVGVASTPQGDTTDKTLLTDFVLEREREDGPYTQLRWLSAPWPRFYGTGQQSVKVTGKRGYCVASSEAADDAQEAIFQLAAWSLDPVAAMADGPLKKVTQGPVTLEYDTQNGVDRASAFKKFYDMKVSEYRRIVI